MEEPLLRRLFLGFLALHVLHQAETSWVFGVQLMEQLSSRGQEVGAGTLYPLLHQLEAAGLLVMQPKTMEGKVRKYYRTTEKGQQLMASARQLAANLLAGLQND
ncbi:MAG: PadR family transcriptional regulator [Bacillota bacterium]|jgi:PadR family transcriptional regulator PadR